MILALGLTTAGCTGSKSLAKKGAKLEEAGLYDNAALFYYNSLLRNSNNVDARIGLARTGQRVVNDKLAEFTKTQTNGDTREAGYVYRDLENYREKLARVGIKTEVPPYFPEDYRELEAGYLEELYGRGSDFLAERKFTEAARVFAEMETLKPGYRDVKALQNVSINEPIYTEAMAHFDAGRYRAAYNGFNRVFDRDPHYKEVSTLRDECLDLGKFAVVIAPLENTTNQKEVADRLHAFLTTSLSTLNDPFVRIVDRSDMERVLHEQRLSHSGLTEAGMAQRAGNLLNASAIVTGSIVKLHTERGSWKKTSHKGYLRKVEKIYDEKTQTTSLKTDYTPTTYNVYTNSTSVSMEFRYKVISAQTGEILFSGIYDNTLSDHAEYAVFSGEATDLFPAGKSGPDMDSRNKKKLLDLLRANRTIKDADQLSKESYHYAASQVADDLVNYLSAL